MIFCVEDDNAIRELVVYTLQSAGFAACGFASGAEMHTALQKQLPQLIILDIMLPGEDGLTLLSQLRKTPATQNVPVMMATAKGSEYDKVKGLDSGADDYLVKPFGMMELISRVKALLRRSAAAESSLLTVGSISLDSTRHKVFVLGEEVVLTRKEFDLLQMLMNAPERVFTRDSVLSTVWGYDFDGETRTVDVHMRTLRQKLGAAGTQLETVRGVGYRINVKPREGRHEA